MNRFIQNDWWPVLKPAFQTKDYQQIHNKLYYEYTHTSVFPNAHQIFEAFKLTPFSKVKVVILGQDPYYNPGKAMGLSFSVRPDFHPIPPSLQNIYKELQNDLGYKPVNHGCLISWALNGVLMLNSILTVKQGQPMSDKNLGWEKITDYAIQKLSEKKQPVVFILWGRVAQKKAGLINMNKNVVIESSHPSSFSARRGFFGSKPFSKTNDALEAFGMDPINWKLPSKFPMSKFNKIMNEYK